MKKNLLNGKKLVKGNEKKGGSADDDIDDELKLKEKSINIGARDLESISNKDERKKVAQDWKNWNDQSKTKTCLIWKEKTPDACQYGWKKLSQTDIQTKYSPTAFKENCCRSNEYKYYLFVSGSVFVLGVIILNCYFCSAEDNHPNIRSEEEKHDFNNPSNHYPSATDLILEVLQEQLTTQNVTIEDANSQYSTRTPFNFITISEADEGTKSDESMQIEKPEEPQTMSIEMPEEKEPMQTSIDINELKQGKSTNSESVSIKKKTQSKEKQIKPFK
jgi:hypothetical protein